MDDVVLAQPSNAYARVAHERLETGVGLCDAPNFCTRAQKRKKPPFKPAGIRVLKKHELKRYEKS